MAQKLPFEFVLVTPAVKVFDFFHRNCNLLPIVVHPDSSRMPGQEIKDVQLLHGKWDSEGSERKWTFAGDYALWEDWTDKVDAVLEQDMYIRFTVMKGKVLEKYNSLKVEYHFSQRNNDFKANGSLIFDKNDSNPVPAPDELKDFFKKLGEAVDNFFQGS